MKQKFDIRNIGLYMFRNVLISLLDGNYISGVLNSISNDSILVDEHILQIKDISDISLYEKIKELHTYAGECDISDFTFNLKELSSLDYEAVLYDEFDCFLISHLILENGIIKLQDISIFKKIFRANKDILSRSKYLYLCKDVIVYGRLGECKDNTISIYTEDGLLNIDLENVCKVLRIPSTNERLDIQTKERIFKNALTISITNDKIAILCDEAYECINIIDIVETRYYGIIESNYFKNSKGTVKQLYAVLSNEKYHIKEAYLRENTNFNTLCDGDTVIFTPSVTLKGYTAQNVVSAISLGLEYSDDEEIPDLIPGESIALYTKNSKSSIMYVFDSENENDYLVKDFDNNLTTVSKSNVEKTCRFGVISNIDFEKMTVSLNNNNTIRISIVDAKIIDYLKNNSINAMINVQYSIVENRIVEVKKITKDILLQLHWKEDNILYFSKTENTLQTKGMRILFTSDLNQNPTVSKLISSPNIKDKNVFVKSVSHQFYNKQSNSITLQETIVQLQCSDDVLRVKYNSRKNNYIIMPLGWEVFGSSSILSEKDGKDCSISFVLSENKRDLYAYLSEEKQENVLFNSKSPYHSLFNKKSPSQLFVESIFNNYLIVHLLNQTILPYISDVQQDDNNIPINVDECLKMIDRIKKDAEWKITPKIDKALWILKIMFVFPDVLKGYMLSVALDSIKLLRKSLFKKYLSLMKTDNNQGKLTSYLVLLINLGKNHDALSKFYLYHLFSLDFNEQIEKENYTVMKYEQDYYTLIEKMFLTDCNDVQNLVSHLVLIRGYERETIVKMVEKNPVLRNQLSNYLLLFDDKIQLSTTAETFNRLYEIYCSEKVRTCKMISEFIDKQGDIDELIGIIRNCNKRFAKFTSKDDENNLNIFLDICVEIQNSTYLNSFEEKTSKLIDVYTRSTKFKEDNIGDLPCIETTELILNPLVKQNLIDFLRCKVESMINEIYNNEIYLPKIECNLNESAIEVGQKNISFIIRNGENNTLQPISKFDITFSSNSSEIIINDDSISFTVIKSGEMRTSDIFITKISSSVENFEIKWRANFDIADSFCNGRTLFKTVTLCNSSKLVCNIVTDPFCDKNYNAPNPYKEAAQGQPLDDDKMFFGRANERNQILDSLICEEKNDFNSGNAVIIFGQKKCGKTSLINQIKNHINQDVSLREKAIVLNFNNILDEIGGIEEIEHFKKIFYAMILFRFSDEVYENHPDVLKILEDNNIVIPSPESIIENELWAIEFENFFSLFKRVDNGNHKILLFMDEFTLLCTSIQHLIDEDPSKKLFANELNFIKTFSKSLGFIQIIIGHEAMMSAFDKLGVLNHTAEFAKVIEIASLDKEASIDLIRKPMKETFCYDTYSTTLGDLAVEKMLTLSGCNPTYLMRMCNELFHYYVNRDLCNHAQIYPSDIENMLTSYISSLTVQDFDILLREDGDEIGNFEELSTYQFLKWTAILSSNDYYGFASTSDIIEVLKLRCNFNDDRIDKTRHLLEVRHVITVSDNKVKINNGLFVEFINQKNR